MGFIKRIKENKQKAKREEIFTSYLRSSINVMNTLDDYFENHYSKRMELHKINLSELDKKLKELPHYLETYRQLLGQLVKISDGNSVFFTSREEANVDLSDEKISSDIIATIPALAEFVEISNVIIFEIHNVLSNIVFIERNSWNGLKSNDQSIVDNCCDLYWRNFDAIVNGIWEMFCDEHKEYNNQTYFEEFKSIAEKDKISQDAWFEIWFGKMKTVMINHNYSNQFLNLTAEIDNIVNSFGNPKWITVLGLFGFSHYSSLSIKPSDCIKGESVYKKAELIRIQNLYTTNQITGKYFVHKDPKYKEE